MSWFKKNFYIFILVFIFALFYSPFILRGLLPIPADTIVGMYHPFRDKIWDNYLTGVPFKNPLITDPVRQQYVWRDLALSQIKKGQLPLWNPFSFSGTPLLANFQTAAFYPLNFLYFFLPTSLAWTWQVMLSQFLAAVFLYFFLRNLNISGTAAFLGSLAFSFSGFAIAWLTWNTILHVAVWTILALLSIDKIIQGDQRPIKWYLIFLFSLVSAFFAGHLQIFFYSFVLIISYLAFRLLPSRKNKNQIFLSFVMCYLLFVILSLPQSLPALKFISLSARDIDQGAWAKPGWFIPWQNLVQFVAPDYFGNPATGNYFGIWNYGEFIGYLGILPLILSFLALICLRQREIVFFGCVLMISLLFSLPTAPAQLPFRLNLPLLSSAQPTRLIYLIDLSLAVLASFGFDYFLELKEKKRIFLILIPLSALFVFLWISASNPVSQRNLILPGCLTFALLIIFFLFFQVRLKKLLLIIVIAISVFDLLRFARKFTPATPGEWLYPQTEITKILGSDKSLWRMMSLDRRIMPPEFSVAFRFQDVAGYDPLYLKSYSLLVSSWNSAKPQKELASFNRILTPDNADSVFTDLLNVKYLLSLNSLDNERFTLIAREGETRLYLNNNYFNRVWLADEIIKVDNSYQELEAILGEKENLKSKVYTSEKINLNLGPENKDDDARILDWEENKITVKTKTQTAKILVLSEIYYPDWVAEIDGQKTRLLKVDYNLRAVAIPGGEHTVEIYQKLI